MSGKGDKRRPSSVSQSQFDENWNKAFNRNQIQKDWNQQGQPTDLWAFPREKSGDMLREVNYDGTWQHSCTVEMGVMWIGKNETCNYCGSWEEDEQ